MGVEVVSRGLQLHVRTLDPGGVCEIIYIAYFIWLRQELQTMIVTDRIDPHIDCSHPHQTSPFLERFPF
jgi:hypothetical protein